MGAKSSERDSRFQPVFLRRGPFARLRCPGGLFSSVGRGGGRGSGGSESKAFQLALGNQAVGVWTAMCPEQIMVGALQQFRLRDSCPDCHLFDWINSETAKCRFLWILGPRLSASSSDFVAALPRFRQRLWAGRPRRIGSAAP